MLDIKIWKRDQQPSDPDNNVVVVEHDCRLSEPRYEVILTKDGATRAGVAFRRIIEDAVETAGEEAEKNGLDATVYVKLV